MNQDYIVKDQAELQALLGTPKELVKQKVVESLDEVMSNFIARSPLVFISTSDQDGLLDISPKGDEPGFVKVDDADRLLIPERPGNKLMFGFNNILQNNTIGLLFIIPGTRETLRVKGLASISRDPEVLDALSTQGKPALLCTYVDVKQCFFHCGKAMIRSMLWKPESWQQDEQLMVQHFANKNKVDEKQIESNLEQSYKENLY